MGAAEGSADPSDAAEQVPLVGKSEPQLLSLLSLTEQGGAREDSFLSPALKSFGKHAQNVILAELSRKPGYSSLWSGQGPVLEPVQTITSLATKSNYFSLYLPVTYTSEQ